MFPPNYTTLPYPTQLPYQSQGAHHSAHPVCFQPDPFTYFDTPTEQQPRTVTMPSSTTHSSRSATGRQSGAEQWPSNLSPLPAGGNGRTPTLQTPSNASSRARPDHWIDMSPPGWQSGMQSEQWRPDLHAAQHHPNSSHQQTFVVYPEASSDAQRGRHDPIPSSSRQSQRRKPASQSRSRSPSRAAKNSSTDVFPVWSNDNTGRKPPSQPATTAEEKRRRNTEASTRFRIRRKQRTLNMQHTIDDLAGKAEELEKEAEELRRENGWLKEILVLKKTYLEGGSPDSQSAEVVSHSEKQSASK